MDKEDWKGVSQFVFSGVQSLHDEKMKVMKEIASHLHDISCSLSWIYEHATKENEQ
jgi:hypothetical protein